MLDERALRDEATDLLRDLIRIDTSNPPGHETPAARLLQDYLEAAGVACELAGPDPDRLNLIARLPGRAGGPSLMFLGHTDVVPAEADAWTPPPFAAVLDDDGYVWGRGAVDMKNEVATRAVALAALARSGFRPQGDLVLVAASDEEEGTNLVGASWLVRERYDLVCDFVLNEGAAERLPLADGRTVATLHVGEKGALAARLVARGAAGPTTLPVPGAGAIGRLAALLVRLDRHRPQRRLGDGTGALLAALTGPPGEDLDAAVEGLVALHPAFAELLVPLFALTIAPSRLHGSDALNVLPGRATADCDCRLLPGDGLEEVLDELAEALGDDIPYEVEVLDGPVGGSASPVDTRLFAACRNWVAHNDPGTILLPALTNGFTDSHYLRETFGSVAYGFWPVRHTPYEVAAGGVHGHDERIHIDDLGYATRFHVEIAQALSER